MKNLFEWTQEYGIGVDNIDAQHRDLFNIANRLFDELQPGELEEVLMEMYRHTRQHFRDEEQLMKDVGYPTLDEHRRQHDDLLTKFNELSTSVVNAPEQLPALRIFLAEWVTEHTLNHDQQFRTFLDENIST